MIRGKIKYFDMDYFGSKQCIAELDNNHTIHCYHNGKSDCIDIYKGNEIMYHRCIPDYYGRKYEYIHLCRGYLKVKFKAFFPEINASKIYTATIPHDIGKMCTVV